MSSSAEALDVWLGESPVGILERRSSRVTFAFTDEYWDLADRPLLGLRFENHPRQGVAATGACPAWFSNLLPEGVLRRWLESDTRSRSAQEFDLLARIGHDLPGAIRLFPSTGELPAWFDQSRSREAQAPPTDEGDPLGGLIKFSLAGVGLKFSMLHQGDRLTIPAHGQGGDWIVKMPDPAYPHVPLNEYETMKLAERVGITVPEVRLRSRDELPDLPQTAWPRHEVTAFSVRRFDRGPNRELIHMEDMNQVRDFPPIPPKRKYTGTFDTVGSLYYRAGQDPASFLEFCRRLTLCILIGNGDMHLKNWSLIYDDPRRPRISPAYDLLCTEVYSIVGRTSPEDMGLKFHKTRQFDEVRLSHFLRLADRIGADRAAVEQTVVETVQRTREAWPETEDRLMPNLPDTRRIGSNVQRRIVT